MTEFAVKEVKCEAIGGFMVISSPFMDDEEDLLAWTNELAYGASTFNAVDQTSQDQTSNESHDSINNSGRKRVLWESDVIPPKRLLRRLDDGDSENKAIVIPDKQSPATSADDSADSNLPLWQNDAMEAVPATFDGSLSGDASSLTVFKQEGGGESNDLQNDVNGCTLQRLLQGPQQRSNLDCRKQCYRYNQWNQIIIIRVCNLICCDGVENCVSAQTLHPDMMNYAANWYMPYISGFHSSIRRINKDDHFTNAISANLTVHKEIPCSTKIYMNVQILIQSQFTKFSDGELTLDAYLNNWPNTVTGATVESLRSCITPYLNCPIMPGNYNAVDCTISTTEKLNMVSKTWNVTFAILTKSGLPIGDFWVTMENDDTYINRVRRPSAIQKKRRENNRKTQ